MSAGGSEPFIGRVTAIELERIRKVVDLKLLLTRRAAFARVVAQLLVAAVLSAASASAMLPSASTPAGPAKSCCAQMMHAEGKCPPQPSHDLTGSCCNTQTCLQLFLQTEEFQLEPASIAVEWASVGATEISRFDLPAVPPPRS